MNKDQVLPKGFYFLSNDELKNNRNYLTSFINESTNIFTEVVEFPPVAFAQTFRIGSNITGSKTYEFKDRVDRDLILTPDSIAHVFNYYLINNNHNKCVKYSWISPIFRYRNIRKRHYYQIGYASLNHLAENEIIDLFLCIRQLIRFLKKSTSKKIIITVYNSALVREIISYIIPNMTEVDLFFDRIRNLAMNAIYHTINSKLPESEYKVFLNKIFSNVVTEISTIDALEKFQEGKKIRKFIELITTISEVEIRIELSTLYCSEILNGVGFTLTIDDNKIGDGGIYNIYGNRYDKSIATVISVCAGSGFYQYIESSLTDKSVLMCVRNYKTNIQKVLFIADEISEMGYKISAIPWSENIRKYITEDTSLLFIDEATQNIFSGRFAINKRTSPTLFQNLSAQELLRLVQESINPLNQ